MRALPALVLAGAAAACSGGGLGDILGGVLTGGDAGQAQQGTVTVEVQEVQESQQQIMVRTDDGQQGPILYDANTQVVYQNQQYPVRSLERGDIVDMRVQQVQQGYYTDLIQVRTPVQERQGGYRGSPEPDVYRVEGTIGQIDLDRWMFTLNMTQGGSLPVYLPSSAPASARDRLRQHQPGDYVRVEVRPLDQQTAELVRFGWS
jgi:translation initiation factor IF-1